MELKNKCRDGVKKQYLMELKNKCRDGVKKQYLMELKNKRRDGDISEVKSLPTKVRGRPVLLGSTLDGQVKSANWLIGSLASLSQKPEIVINGFKKAVIFDALSSDGQ